MKKIFIALTGLFILNEILHLFTEWGQIDWMNLTGFVVVGCIAIYLDKRDCNE